MKIYPLRHGVSFHLQYLSFLSVSVKRCEKITKGVNRVVAHSTYYVTKQPIAPRAVISNAPAINRCGVFSVYFITSLTLEYLPVYNLDNVFRMYFAIIQLLYHVNALVNKRL